MHKLKKYWEKVSADPVKIEEMEEIVCEALEEIRGRCPRLFWDTAYKLHCVAYGPHFDEHLAKKAVARMKNVDGSSGEHWTYEQTSQLLGFPATYLVANEIAIATGETEEERQVVNDAIMPKYLVGGFATVTTFSVITAGILEKFL